MASGVQVKGSGIAPTMKFIRKKYGDEKADQVLARLSDEVRRTVTVPLAGTWYPVEHVGELCTAIRAVLSTDTPDCLFEIARESATDAFNLIYRVFFRLGSPAFIVKRVASVWGSLCDSGTLSVADHGSTHLVVRLDEFPYKNPDYCAERLRGWFQAALEVSGCDITTSRHTKCVAHGHECCEWRFEWN